MTDFHSNKDNKQWFLRLLGEHIATCGCEIAYSIGTERLRHLWCSTGGWWHWPAWSPDSSCWWKQAYYLLPTEPKKGAAFRCTGVNLIRHKVEKHMPSRRGDTVTYNQVICDRESSWIKTCKRNKTFREQAELILSRSMKSSKHQVIAADEKVMTIVLKGKQSDHLDTMIYQRFQELITTGKKGNPPQHVATKVCNNKVPHHRSLQAGPTVTKEYFAGWILVLRVLWRKIESNETLDVPLNHFLILWDASVRQAVGHYDVGAWMSNGSKILEWLCRHVAMYLRGYVSLVLATG